MRIYVLTERNTGRFHGCFATKKSLGKYLFSDNVSYTSDFRLGKKIDDLIKDEYFRETGILKKGVYVVLREYNAY